MISKTAFKNKFTKNLEKIKSALDNFLRELQEEMTIK